MSSLAERFIELATDRAAGDASQVAAAAAVLRDRIAAHGGNAGNDLEAAVAALERTGGHPRRWRWGTVLTVVTLAVSLPMLGLWAKRFWDFKESALPPFGASEKVLPMLGGPLREPVAGSRLLLFGKAGARTAADRWRPLWQSEPENVAFLARYAAACAGESAMMPPEILTAAARLDPDNGWFPAAVAANRAKTALEQGKITQKDARAGKPVPWRVLDEAAFRESLELIHRAAAMPAFRAYEAELRRREMAVLPPASDWLSVLGKRNAVSDQERQVFLLRHCGQALAVAAERCAERRDPEGFGRCLAEWRWLYQVAAREAGTLVGQLVARSIAVTHLPRFQKAAETLGMVADAGILATLRDGFQRERDAAGERPERLPADRLARERGSLLAPMWLHLEVAYVKHPPPLTEAELRPGRLMEQAVFDRLFAVAWWVMLGLAVAIAGGICREPACRCVISRLTDLLRPADWGWIVAGGVAMPVAWFLGVTRGTLLSGREWSLGWPGFAITAGQHLALVLLVLLVPITLARWRLGLRGAGLGFKSRGLWVNWLAVALLVAAVPGMEWVTGAGGGDSGILARGLLLLGSPALMVLVEAGCLVLGNGQRGLPGTLVCRAVGPAWLCAMLLCGIAMPIHRAEECHWVGQDRLMGLSERHPALSHHEALLVAQLRAETLERLKPLENLAGR